MKNIKVNHRMIDELRRESDLSVYYQKMEKFGWLINDYTAYMTTAPMHVDKELLRLPEADLFLCAALLTLSLREDHFCEGTFEARIRDGSFARILDRMEELIV